MKRSQTWNLILWQVRRLLDLHLMAFGAIIAGAWAGFGFWAGLLTLAAGLVAFSYGIGLIAAIQQAQERVKREQAETAAAR